MQLKQLFVTFPFFFLACLPVAVSQAQIVPAPTVEAATAVLQEIMAIPARQIPNSLLRDAHGVAIIPNVVKGGFVVGVRFGRGVMLTRGDNGAWQPPVFISLTGGSVGWQAGLQATDVVLVFRTRRSIDGLMNNKLTLGVNASAAAGPVGRNASAATDLSLGAEILSYSRSRGLFAGAALDGSVIQIDHATGASFYQQPVMVGPGAPAPSPQTLPPSAVQLMNLLTQYSQAAPAADATATAAAQPTPATANLVPAENVVGAAQVNPRQQLAASSQQLQKLLDPQWRQFLALPAEIYSGNDPPNKQTLEAALQNYNTVANDPSFRALAQRPEFATTHRLLKQYVSAVNSTVPTHLTLPPPPAGSH
jgi:lipid-binding SYLF domain-containing protein